ncbi:MAG: PQQ-dependent sugar dehydrogenase [Anaerolineae bacterium]|nr:PQQ-dependent sugar dehydrogenase [Anaerolineae bacterium]
MSAWMWISLLLPGAAAQELPPCAERATFRDPPWINGRRYCLETVIEDPEAGELAFTALAVAPDGTLYAARPLHGQVLAITDTNADGLPDTSRIVAEGLTLPNGLTYHEGALYIAGGRHLYRLMGGAVEILADDLPVGSSGWAGDLAVGPDERLYLSIGASCDFCEPDQPEHGAILSLALDGSDRMLVATGLRQAAGLAFRDGVLWATDSARLGLAATPDLDELNQVTPGAQFGWPICIGVDRRPDPDAADFDCTATTAPALTFPTGSTPLGLAAYDSDTLPDLASSLLVVLNGSRDRPDLRGYALAVIPFDTADEPQAAVPLIPVETDSSRKVGYTVAEMNYRGSGFWPHRPYDVTVSPQGWIYLSVGGGQIMAVRPR